MPKYYVMSGNLQDVLIADNPQAAIKKAFQRKLEGPEGEDIVLGLIMCVSEKGFGMKCKNDLIFDTKFALKTSGFDEYFDT